MSEEHKLTIYACTMAREADEYAFIMRDIKGMIGLMLESQKPGFLSTRKREFSNYSPGTLVDGLRTQKIENLERWGAQQWKETFDRNPKPYIQKAEDLFTKWKGPKKVKGYIPLSYSEGGGR